MKTFIDDLHAAQVPAGRACQAAQITHMTLANWVREPAAILLTNGERKAWGARTQFLFTLLRVYQLAITAELVRAGFAPRRAAVITAAFTDVERIGRLYPEGVTLLVASPDQDFGDVLNVTGAEPWTVLFWKRLNPSQVSTLTIVNLNEVVARVRLSLGLPMIAPREEG